MATAGATAAVAVAAQHTSSYRVKFKRKEFLELTEIANQNSSIRQAGCTFSHLTAL